MLVAPDTSPRNTGIEGEDDDWDFGGASFYVDATVEPGDRTTRCTAIHELPALIGEHFPVQSERQGIFGHSMVVMGRCALRNPDRSSRFSFCTNCGTDALPWGQKAFTHYLGPTKRTGVYDASELVLTVGYNRPILIDQGTADPFLAEQLLPDVFERACDCWSATNLALPGGLQTTVITSSPLGSKITSATTPPPCAGNSYRIEV